MPSEAWQRDVLQIMREESYYFYPQLNTKIMNEAGPATGMPSCFTSTMVCRRTK